MTTPQPEDKPSPEIKDKLKDRLKEMVLIEIQEASPTEIGSFFILLGAFIAFCSVSAFVLFYFLLSTLKVV